MASGARVRLLRRAKGGCRGVSGGTWRSQGCSRGAPGALRSVSAGFQVGSETFLMEFKGSFSGPQGCLRGFEGGISSSHGHFKGVLGAFKEISW